MQDSFLEVSTLSNLTYSHYSHLNKSDLYSPCCPQCQQPTSRALQLLLLHQFSITQRFQAPLRPLATSRWRSQNSFSNHSPLLLD